MQIHALLPDTCTVKVPFGAALLIESTVGLEGHSLVECVCIKIQ